MRACRLPEVESVTPQEEQLLNSLAERVNQTQLREKDPDAEAFLTKSLGSNPDALYILAQTVLVENIALEQARGQIAQLQQAQQAQQQAPQPARATSFLGSLLGHLDPQPAPVLAQQGYMPPPPPPNFAPAAYGQPQFQQPQYAPVATGQPSFLSGALQTAGGVAAGALAFEGVEAILHGLGGFGHPGFGMGGFGMGPGMGMGMGSGMGSGFGMTGAGFERPVEETVVNNYYDQPGPGHEKLAQSGFQGGEEHHFHESADQFSNQGGAQLSDASYNTVDNSQGSYDNSGSAVDDGGSFDNSGTDDSSGFDSGGGFDGGGGSDSGGGGDLL